MTVKRLTTRGYATAEAIRHREPFTTSGALKGCYAATGMRLWQSGALSGEDLDRFKEDAPAIDYVVISYATPIAWHTLDGWYKVAQRFSVTTSRHQGLLYLLD